MLNIVCLNPDNKREHVEILHDMVRRNLPEGLEGRFICYTDDKRKYSKGIEKLPLENYDLIKFSNEIIVQISLNLCVVGAIDDIQKLPIGFHKIDEVFKVYDYTHHPLEIPKGAKLIRVNNPENVKLGWIPYVWKIGGMTTSEFEVVCNTEDKILIKNIQHSLRLGLPKLQLEKPHEGHAIIVGGGPSLKENLGLIKKYQEHGAVIFSTNNTYRYLLENGIKADCHVMLDPRPDNAEFVFKGPLCYYCSHCDPSVFKAAENVILYHHLAGGIEEIIGKNTGDPLMGGSSVGLKAISIAFCLGYRALHIFGMDSSHSDTHHAYPQKLNDNDKIIEIVMNDKKYKVSPWMVTQVEEFKDLMQQFIKAGGIATIHGSGLLPDVATIMSEPYSQQQNNIANLSTLSYNSQEISVKSGKEAYV